MSFLVLLVELATVVWFFVLGACFGSFLNVVIYRLPRRMTLLGTSRCPQCDQQIAFRDNIPVIAWWLLRGRCRRCDRPIAARYWKVELTVGLGWAILAVVEIALGGINLPTSASPYFGFAFNLMGPRWELLLSMMLHAGLLMQLLLWGMIKRDGYGPPLVWTLSYFVAAIAVVLCVPELHYACGWADVGPSSTPVHLTWDLLVGILLGIYLAATMDPSGADETKRSVDRVSWVISMLAVAVTLGLGSFPSLITLIYLIAGWPSLRSLPIAGTVGIAAIVQILFWRPLDWLVHSSGATESAGHLILATIVIAIGMSLVLGWVKRR